MPPTKKSAYTVNIMLKIKFKKREQLTEKRSINPIVIKLRSYRQYCVIFSVLEHRLSKTDNKLIFILKSRE